MTATADPSEGVRTSPLDAARALAPLIRELAERLGPLPAAAADPVGDAPAMELRAN